MTNLSRHQRPAPVAKCAPVLTAAVEGPDAHDHALSVLHLFPEVYHDATRSQADRMVADAEKLLADKYVAVRLAASRALVQMGSTASIPVLRSVIATEPLPWARVTLQQDLETFEKLQ